MAAGLRPHQRQMGDTQMVRVHFLLRGQVTDDVNKRQGFDLAEAHAMFNKTTALPYNLRLPLCASSVYDGDPDQIGNCLRYTLAQLVRCRVFVCRRVHAICSGSRLIQSWWRGWLRRRAERKAAALQKWRADDERIRAKARERIEAEQKAYKRARCEAHRKEAQARQRAATSEYTRYNTDDELRVRAIDRIWEQRCVECKQKMKDWINENVVLENRASSYFRDMRRVFGRTWAGTGDDIERARADLGYVQSLIDLRKLRANRPRLRFHTVTMKEFRAMATAVHNADRAERRRLSSECTPVGDGTPVWSDGTPEAVAHPFPIPKPDTHSEVPSASRLPPIPRPTPQPVKSVNARHTAPVSVTPDPRRTAGMLPPLQGRPDPRSKTVGSEAKGIDLSGLREGFSAATVRVVEEAFIKSDADGDGNISRDEMVSFLEGLYFATGAPAPCDDSLRREVVETFRKCDVDRNGRLSPEELVGFLPRSHFREALSKKKGKHRALAPLPGAHDGPIRPPVSRRRMEGSGDHGALSDELNSILYGHR
eukprot:Hpha_TRINITY_DN16903_c2_g6::TRINITY_DN16903_c2_g6_i1::g.53515::m.53515